MDDSPIHHDLLFLAQIRLKAQITAFIANSLLEECHKNDITLKVLAAKIGTTDKWIKKTLIDGDLTLDEISDLLLSIGAELDFEVVRREHFAEAAE